MYIYDREAEDRVEDEDLRQAQGMMFTCAYVYMYTYMYIYIYTYIYL